jgi:hypothetical protein
VPGAADAGISTDPAADPAASAAPAESASSDTVASATDGDVPATPEAGSTTLPTDPAVDAGDDDSEENQGPTVG